MGDYDNDNKTTEACSVAKLAIAGSEIKCSNQNGGVPFVITPTGFEIKPVPFLDKPRMIDTSKSFGNLSSFLAYAKDWIQPHSFVWSKVSSDGCRFGVTFDYHKDESNPGWCEHNAEVCLAFSDEFRSWHRQNGSWMDHGDFAEFMEEHSSDVVEPDSADILEISQSLSASKSVVFKSGKRLQNGDMSLAYETETKATGGNRELQIPAKLKIAFPVFVDGDELQLEAKFRYKIEDTEAYFLYKIEKLKEQIKNAGEAAATKVAATLGAVVHELS